MKSLEYVIAYKLSSKKFLFMLKAGQIQCTVDSFFVEFTDHNNNDILCLNTCIISLKIPSKYRFIHMSFEKKYESYDEFIFERVRI